jgi:Zn-dependent protease with chaperone function
LNFFQAQDKARRKTLQLGILFGLAVLTLVILTNLLIAVFLGWAGIQTGLTWTHAISNVPWDAWVWISLGVVGVVGVACGYKYLSLQGGGRTIAESLGGHLIHQNTRDTKQRRLLNVVEEMAIASGISVPPVYLIPEPSINAFAAGFNADDAVIGINQGTLDLLSRSELQGVVAHEFSHILNGDTNINLRLIAILHGILFVGMIGYGLMRAGGYSRKNGAPLLVLGIGLLVIGYGGTFFGNLIKAAVSRQREYLADASAVQFTRDPSSIADALKKIGGYSYGSTMSNRAAEEASHMFFGAVATKFTANLMATHPPLDQRIRAIEPRWDGKFPHTEQIAGSGAAEQPGVAGFAGSASFTPATATGSSATPDAVVERVGRPDQSSLNTARQLIAAQDDVLRNAAHDPFDARALVYAMLIDPNPEVAQNQWRYLHANAERGVASRAEQLYPMVRDNDAAHRLTLFEMAAPALKELSYDQYKRFSNNAAKLITEDGHIDVFEWVLHRLLTKELIPHFEGPQNYHGRIRNISKLAPDAARLLSILASHTHTELDEQQHAYRTGASMLALTQPFAKQEAFDYRQMNESLASLRKLTPLAKPALIKACTATVLADGTLNSTEGALLQGIAATLDCPLPPLD